MVWKSSIIPMAKGCKSRVKIIEEIIIIDERMIISEIQRIV